MYFSNISNEELQHFHRINGVDMSMSLSQIINSNLFNVEAIIPNKLYRVCPLFYCEKIISSNSNDKILDNSCAILQKNEKETYLSFVTNSDSKIIVNDSSFFNSKKINQKLTSIEEYNGLVYTLRQQGVLNGNINTEENIIEGSYGTYILNFNEDILRNDVGFIINDELKNNPLSIKLTDSFFINAKYTLTCTVVSLTGANVCDDDSSDYINKDIFSITLVEDSEVIIDLSNYVNDSVLLFDMDVSISFDVPEIVNSNFSLSLVVDSSRIALGESIVLTATLSGEDNVSNYYVQFFEDGNLIDTGTTDSEGIASITFTPSVASNHIYSCNLLGLSSNVNVKVGMYDTELRLVSDKSIAFIPTTFVVTGSLRNEIGALNNATVKLYNNNTLIDTVTTENDGSFSYEITANTNATYNIQAVFESTGYNNRCDSNIVTVTARKLNTNITINVDKSTVYYPQTPLITGVLKDELSNNMGNTYITLYDGNNRVTSTTTYNNGNYAFNPDLSEYGSTHNFKVVYHGDDTHNNVTSATKIVTYQKAPTYINIDKNEYNVGENIKINVNSNYGTFNPTSIYYELLNSNSAIIFEGSLSTKDSDGYFTFNLPGVSTGEYTLRVTYNGDSNYQSSKLNKVINVTNTITLSKITLSKNGNNLILNYKDSNNQNLINYDIIGTRITIGQRTFDYASTALTDSNGNAKLENLGSTVSTGTRIVAQLKDITSNTLTW